LGETRSLAIESVQIRGFRNLTAVDIELGPRLNVLSGENGQGKTNLLEALYVLATTKSFRTPKLGELVGVGAEVASVRAAVREQDEKREQSVGLRAGGRVVRMDGKRPTTLAGYAVRTPTVAFHSGVLAVSMGGGSERRRVLDRIALYHDPGSLAEADAYAKALRARQRVLEERGEGARDLREWEELVVRHGMAVSRARQAATERLAPAARGAFEAIGPAGLVLEMRYVGGAPAEPEAFRAALSKNRPRDRARGAATAGPHRDDVSLALGGFSVRGRASQGQHRAVVLALLLAEIAVIATLRGVQPVLLLDDVSSELDPARMAALFDALRSAHGQVLVTTTRPELIDTSGVWRVEGRRDFRVVEGLVTSE
jgi:DNA replication and repair protein RecF